MSENAKIQYTSRDYNSLLTDMVESISSLTSLWTSREDSDPGMVLLKQMASSGDMLHYCMDKQSLEFYRSTVTQRKNAKRILEPVGYKLHWYRSAVLNLKITNNMDYDIVLNTNISNPTGTTQVVYSSSGNLPRYLILPLSPNWQSNSAKLLKAGESLTVECAQGELNSINFEVNSITNNRYYLDTGLIDEAHMWLQHNVVSDGQLVSDGSCWNLVENLNTVTDIGNYFMFDVDEYDRPFIELVPYWEDKYAKRNNGETFTLYYLKTLGSLGNVAANAFSYGGIIENLPSGTITIDGIDIPRLLIEHGDNNVHSVINSDAPGLDVETVEQAYKNSSKLMNTYNTLVTISDFEKYLTRQLDTTNCVAVDRQRALDLNKIIVKNAKISELSPDDNNSVVYRYVGNSTMNSVPYPAKQQVNKTVHDIVNLNWECSGNSDEDDIVTATVTLFDEHSSFLGPFADFLTKAYVPDVEVVTQLGDGDTITQMRSLGYSTLDIYNYPGTSLTSTQRFDKNTNNKYIGLFQETSSGPDTTKPHVIKATLHFYTEIVLALFPSMFNEDGDFEIDFTLLTTPAVNLFQNLGSNDVAGTMVTSESCVEDTLMYIANIPNYKLNLHTIYNNFEPYSVGLDTVIVNKPYYKLSGIDHYSAVITAGTETPQHTHPAIVTFESVGRGYTLWQDYKVVTEQEEDEDVDYYYGTTFILAPKTTEDGTEVYYTDKQITEDGYLIDRIKVSTVASGAISDYKLYNVNQLCSTQGITNSSTELALDKSLEDCCIASVDTQFGDVRVFDWLAQGTIYLYEPVDSITANAILCLVVATLYNTFLPSNLGMGEKPKFMDIVQTITSADERIRFFDPDVELIKPMSTQDIDKYFNKVSVYRYVDHLTSYGQYTNDYLRIAKECITE